ncbi:hypothetical protein [Catenovulum agarivorans]|uniref:hypothetical protein n=1 Tax=Catenovulum agarivorans TaxID=1172192 RepID=UPI0004AD849E|nr:hypothetical protein [Catenovulum agarivorans]
MSVIQEKLQCDLCGWHGVTGELVIVDNELTCPSCCGDGEDQNKKREDSDVR